EPTWPGTSDPRACWSSRDAERLRRGGGRALGRSDVKRPAVLLDRDGTLNVDLPEGVSRLEDFVPIARSFEAVGRLTKAGWPVAAVTNQPVIGGGLAPQAVVAAIPAECARLAAEHGGRFAGSPLSPDRPASGNPRRKPMPGLLFEA